jgi:hypothetical protein
MKRTLIAVAALVACACLAATALAVAKKPANTSITIEGQGGAFFSGEVNSSKRKCANGRKVNLYKQKGSSPDTSKDTKVGSDIAQANNNTYQWATGDDSVHSGKYYARTAKLDGCKTAQSQTLKAS